MVTVEAKEVHSAGKSSATKQVPTETLSPITQRRTMDQPPPLFVVNRLPHVREASNRCDAP